MPIARATAESDSRQLLREAISRILLGIFALIALTAVAAELSGRVVGVTDGDTITVLIKEKTQVKVRLAGIDSPEKGQAFGNRAKENLSNLVFNKQVVVEWAKVDQYGRTVGRVLVDGKDANLEQVRSGVAWHYKEYAREQQPEMRIAYAKAETAAKSEGKGLWKDNNPQAPWDARKEKSQVTASSTSSGCPCSGATKCTGPRGGEYCMAPNGKKRY